MVLLLSTAIVLFTQHAVSSNVGFVAGSSCMSGYKAPSSNATLKPLPCLALCHVFTYIHRPYPIMMGSAFNPPGEDGLSLYPYEVRTKEKPCKALTTITSLALCCSYADGCV